MSIDCVKQKDTQVTVEIVFLFFFKHQIFLDTEVKLSSISNSPDNLRLIFKEIWESFAQTFLLTLEDNVLRVKQIEPEITVRKMSTG